MGGAAAPSVATINNVNISNSTIVQYYSYEDT